MTIGFHDIDAEEAYRDELIREAQHEHLVIEAVRARRAERLRSLRERYLSLLAHLRPPRPRRSNKQP